MGLNAPAWTRRYRRRLVLSDTVIVFASVFSAQLVRLDLGAELTIPTPGNPGFTIDYSALSVLLAGSWLASLTLGETRDAKVIGIGPIEYHRVVIATGVVFGVFAILAFSLRVEVGRGYLLIALPVGLSLLLLSRWLWRKRLHHRRQELQDTYRTLIVGEQKNCAHIAREIARNRFTGFALVGAVTERGETGELVPGLPVVGDYDRLLDAVEALRIDTLIMTSPDAIAPERMRRIGWELESRDVDLIVTVALTDIAGPRFHSRPVAGLPLIHVDHPEFSGRRQLTKRLFDVAGSTMLILFAAPIMLAVAIAVKCSSPGPIIYRQERVGLNGSPFNMLKFRSMRADADAQLLSLLERQGTVDTPLHKVHDDPRITGVGRVIRRYSLDELPQLFNVLAGTMTLVGPRPQREAEVALYAPDHHRRLMVKPGLTGLWQVSGRSGLDWNDAIRLDLYYVENWSITGDLVILWKTLRAVALGDGAQ